MTSLIEGYKYDIFISYRQKDNKGDRWVSEFVDALKDELEATFKEDISVYFDENPHDGLLETHDVDESLKEKLKCLVFIPIISRTYCDPKSFAWEHEFKAFIEQASNDQFGLRVKLPNGNVASRILPVKIHDLDPEDKTLLENKLGGVLRSIEFIYKSAGVNRPLTVSDNPDKNLNKTFYRDQINKVANAIKEIITGLKPEPLKDVSEKNEVLITKMNAITPEKSIIVLPFENISSDPEQEYFSDGLTEEIITHLSFIKDLLVISRSSAMTFKGSKRLIREIAEKVNVKYVLEGSVRKDKNNLRITAQLIDAENDIHLWAKTFNGTLDDIFDVQEKVSVSIAKELDINLNYKDLIRLSTGSINDLQVFEYYYKANQKIFRFTENDINEAIDYLNKAISDIGENALLYTCKAWGFWMLVNMGYKQEEYLKLAEETINKAIALQPDLSRAHAIYGWIYFFRKNIFESIIKLKKALEYDPNEQYALQGLVMAYSVIGKTVTASTLFNKLERIDPVNNITLWCKGSIPFFNGQFEQSLEAWREFFEAGKDLGNNPYYYVLAMLYTRDKTEILRYMEPFLNEGSKNIFDKLLIIIKHAINKDSKELLSEFDQDFVQSCKRDITYAHHLAISLSLCELKNEAIDWLEQAVELGYCNYPMIKIKDKLLENIRGEVRFQKLLERVKHEWENFKV